MSQIPTKDQILAWIAENPALSAKRDIAKAFGIKGAARIDLKRVLKELEAEGHLQKRGKTFREAGALPPVTVLELLDPDRDGDLFAKPLEGRFEDAPRILFLPRPGEAAVGPGDRILGRLTKVEGQDHAYEARLIRRIGTGPRKLLGIFRAGSEGGRIVPIDKGSDKEWMVAPDLTGNAKDGELVEAEQAGPKNRLGLPRARVVQRLGDPSAPRAVSLIAIHQHGIPDEFPAEVLAEAERLKPAPLAKREDLRALPFVTIDPSDARDHDDACYAHPDDDPANPGGHVLWVAIADVAHYVTPGSATDREARARGNSTYFPDRVVPMLPERLSADLCSLHEGVARPVIAVRMVVDAEGGKRSHRFTRAMITSRASLSYEEVQAAQDGAPNDRCAALLDEVIAPLYAGYAALKTARAARQPLDLDLPERKIVLSDDGEVVSIALKERFDAHRLIEEFMVLANVAAAEELIRLRRPLLFRVHEEPSLEKLDALREVAQASGFTLAKGQVLHTRHLNRLLAQAEGTDFDELLNITTLRSMQQAYYAPENFGHFGLALRNYAHFTSPIRRYSDLIVHRALILGHGWGKDGLSPQDIEALEETAQHISETERRSMAAERDTTDRYLAAYLSERVGNEFPGRISGVTRFGLFVKLDETGADGLIPIRTLGREFFHFDAASQTLMGSETGLTLGVGQRVTVRLAEAVPVTGGLMLELLSVDDKALPGGRAPRGKPLGRKGGAAKAKARAKATKEKRNVSRKRK
ncbi:ribonuclease R [Defluviimonas sp. 20V17]|uniref:Ribonuclease R n=1 Tax=Allgaiera indica TaxID=765699 RepID=A0AAN4UTM5_9RHOB|nr:ribonuclease R [Allgaiera indica]KDB05485.1 ribonuclease R [Defluviimonas sp. 20V17]GHE04626.1 ribonuclease R [Allgaiera indica]SDX48092.1 RNAse R [Allgaiera indica]